MHDAVAAELALAGEFLGYSLIDDCQIDEHTGEILPVLTIVTDNGGPFRSFTFEAFIATRPERRHVARGFRTGKERVTRTRVRDDEVRVAVPGRDRRRPPARRS